MNQNSELAVIILAAGKGSRMKSNKPKVMHEIAGLPMINWLLSTVETLEPEKIIVVTADGMDDVADAAAPYIIAIQTEQNGTGDAVKAACPHLEGFTGDVLVLLGDVPFITPDTLEDLVNARHLDARSGLVVLGVELDDPTGYGRLIADENGQLIDIVEQKDATPEQLDTNIVNTGAFCVAGEKLSHWLDQLSNENAQGEYYFTDLPAIALEEGYTTALCLTQDEVEIQGINTRAQLAAMESEMQARLKEMALDNGVTMLDPNSVYLSYDVQFGPDVILEPNVFIGKNVSIGSDTRIKAFSHLEGCTIEGQSDIGPYARLRPGAHIEKQARIGNFVEVKNSTIGQGAKANHLAYIGDAEVGQGSNIGAGTITCNYDGFDKHKTIIGKNVFVGSNSTLVAPLNLEDGSFIAAGSAIGEDVPQDALAVARNRPIIRDGWASQFRNGKNK